MEDGLAGLIEAVAQCIEFHEEYAWAKSKRALPAGVRGEILGFQDADRLDAIGAVGLARMFTFGGAYHQPLWHPHVRPGHWEHGDLGSSSYNHLHEKLLKLKDTMNTTTGRRIAEAAARRLVPSVLELGGKSPAIIDPEYPLDKAVGRILFVKQFNAGQVCTNVDYVFVHRSQKQEFIGLALKYAAKHCPDIAHEDYTSIIDEVSFDRLVATLEDARDKGATLVNLSPGQHPDRNHLFDAVAHLFAAPGRLSQ